MQIATWNINGVRARLDGALAWLRDVNPDVLCFQEIKVEDESFPRQAFEDLGYNIATNGQKGFNGVAILSKLPFDEVARGLPGDDGDAQARFIEAVFSVPAGAIRVVSLYLPNGNPVGTDKFAYKLAWIGRFEAMPANGWPPRRCSFLPATSTLSRSPRMRRTPRSGSTTRCTSRKAALPIGV